MIYIVFAPGTYGSYVLQSLYLYSEFGNKQNLKFNANTGSSHDFRDSEVWKEHFTVMHLGQNTKPAFTPNDKCISILPNCDHNLDYFNNQFIKQDHGYLINYILSHITESNFKYKLKSFWNYNSEDLDNIPKWILREWFSFWIEDCWKNGYNKSDYEKLNSTFSFDANNLFVNHVNLFVHMMEKVSIKRVADLEQIEKNSNAFIKLQKYHNSQINCNKWVNDLCNGKVNSTNPCNTIFDEAYIQKKLRDKNIELLCHNLNEFPLYSGDMLQYLKPK